MITQNQVKRLTASTWLMSLVILFSLIGFSGPASAKIDQKKIETEVQVSGKHLSKQRSSFTRLRADLISNNFFRELINFSTACAEHQLNRTLITVLNSASVTFDSFLKPDALSQHVYLARSSGDRIIS